MKDKLIIEKRRLDYMNTMILTLFETAGLNNENYLGKMKEFESELSSLEQSVQSDESANFRQSLDLTDEQWMDLPKEEILQLYKNCYAELERLRPVRVQSVEGSVEEIATSIEHIFKNTERIHGKSEAIDWIKVASSKCVSYFQSKQTAMPTDEENKIRDQKIDIILNTAYNEGYNQTKSKAFDIWCKSTIKQIKLLFNQST